MTEVRAADLQVGMVIMDEDDDNDTAYVTYVEQDTYLSNEMYVVLDTTRVGLMFRSYKTFEKVTLADEDAAREVRQRREAGPRRRRLVAALSKLSELFADQEVPLPDGPIRLRACVRDTDTRRELGACLDRLRESMTTSDELPATADPSVVFALRPLP